MASKRRFAAHVLDSIRRALKRVGKSSVEMWIIVETNRDGRLHIHGGCVCADVDLPALEKALTAAGGDWQDGQQGRQLVIANQYDPDGWVGYCLKDVSRTRKHVRGSLIVRTSGLGDQAKATYEDWRREAQENRRRSKAAAGKASRTPRQGRRQNDRVR